VVAAMTGALKAGWATMFGWGRLVTTIFSGGVASRTYTVFGFWLRHMVNTYDNAQVDFEPANSSLQPV